MSGRPTKQGDSLFGRTMPCPHCDGDGEVSREDEYGVDRIALCSTCGGTGDVPHAERAMCGSTHAPCDSETDHCQCCGVFVPVAGSDCCAVCEANVPDSTLQAEQGDSLSRTEFWKPGLGDEVWMNHPDGRRLGAVVSFVPEGHVREGQPVIEDADEPGRMFAIHPMFCLPFEFGQSEWQQARSEGRIGA